MIDSPAPSPLSPSSHISKISPGILIPSYNLKDAASLSIKINRECFEFINVKENPSVYAGANKVYNQHQLIIFIRIDQILDKKKMKLVYKFSYLLIILMVMIKHRRIQTANS